MTERPTGPRSVALIGPYLSGKTTLLESLLFVTGKIARRGSVGEGNTVGDSSAEARARGMSVEINVATTEYLGDTFTFIDCPGSIEFWQEAADALMGVDAAVVVCEAEAAKAPALAPLMKRLDEFSNKTLTALKEQWEKECVEREATQSQEPKGETDR